MTVLVEKYNRLGALVIGLIQVAASVVLAALQPVHHVYDLTPRMAGGAIWAGFFLIICGGVSIASWRNYTKKMITAVMVLDIVGAVVAGGGMLWMMTMVLVGQMITRFEDDYIIKTEIGVGSFQIILLLIDIVVSIVGAALCCHAVCCGNRLPAEGQIVCVYNVDTSQQVPNPGEAYTNLNPAQEAGKSSAHEKQTL